MKLSKKILCLLCTIILSVTVFAPYALAAAIKEPDGDIIGISNRGNWHEYPENSLPAVLKAAESGIDAVLIDVSLTADGIPVVIEANSAARMLDGAQNEAVSSYTAEQIQSYYLKDRSGGRNNKATKIKVPELADVLKSANEQDITLILKTDASNAAAIAKAVSACENVTVYFTGKEKTVKSAVTEYGGTLDIITEKRGNIVFVQTAYIDFMNKNGAKGVVLKTTNRYGVNFNKTVLKHFAGSSRAIADTSDSETAGAREDTEKWWDDLLSRGYSVIITNDPQGFAEYKKANDTARNRLSEAYTEYTTEWQLPQFKSIIFNDYKKAYTDAVNEAQKLLGDKSSSTQAMNDCRAMLIKACDDIDLNYADLEAGKAGTTVSVSRIALCIGAVIAVVAVQIFFYKRREKA